MGTIADWAWLLLQLIERPVISCLGTAFDHQKVYMKVPNWYSVSLIT